MERYEVISVAGEGSFGRVYKARSKETNEVVAFKVIQKRGRTEKELESLRQECEIQRHLHHPNIIQMLDSFETENEIVVVSEYADKQLYEILGKAGYLPEPRVQQITCDLVAALFYLHSNRVLHRDLKPQNVLLSLDGTAKLCDFGFARNMSRGTMLLTSIKGTPLYMAPELVTESPYDHNADLWSLGCIVYELLVGVPPFSTTSILHLVRLIRHETIRFPDFVSPSCVSFLQGLLQKEPSKRLTWPELLQHPFLQGKVLVPKDQAISIPPFTDPLSISQEKAKESQRLHLTEKLSKQSKFMTHTVQLQEDHDKKQQKVPVVLIPPTITSPKFAELTAKESELNVSDTPLSPDKTPTPFTMNSSVDSAQPKVSEKNARVRHSSSDSDDSNQTPVEASREWIDPNPTQNDEWLDYLQRSMEEVMAGDLSCLLKPPLVAVATAPLARRNASAKVIEYVASLLSIPLVVEDVTSDIITILFETYLESNIVDQILQGIKILITNPTTETFLSIGELRACQLHALERMCLLLCHLVHRQPAELSFAFTQQFCEAINERQDGKGTALLRHMLGLNKRKARVVADILAVLAQVARTLPQHMSIVQNSMLGENPVDFLILVGHQNALIRTRSCIMLRFLAIHCGEALKSAWPTCLPERLDALLRDEEEPGVQQAASNAINELSKLPFYTHPNTTSG